MKKLYADDGSRVFKVVVLGANKAGKSALVNRSDALMAALGSTGSGRWPLRDLLISFLVTRPCIATSIRHLIADTTVQPCTHRWVRNLVMLGRSGSRSATPTPRRSG